MAGSEVPARRANWSASITLSPDDVRIGVEPGAVSASAIRAIDVPMTRAIWTALSTSTMSMATMVWNRRTASISRSVKTASSSSTSVKPRALQNRRARSRGMSVVSVTCSGVRRTLDGTTIRSTTKRSTTSSATARSISSLVHPRSNKRARTRARAWS